MSESPARGTTLALIVLSVGLLYVILPATYFVTLNERLQPPAAPLTPQPTLTPTVVVQGRLTDKRSYESGEGLLYYITFQYPLTPAQGSTDWRSREEKVDEERFAALQVGDPVAVIYSRETPWDARLFDEDLEMPSASAARPSVSIVRVPLPTALALAALIAGGGGMIGWGWRRLRTTGLVTNTRRRRALLAGMVMTLSYGQVLVLGSLFRLAGNAPIRDPAMNTMATLLSFIITPGRMLALLLPRNAILSGDLYIQISLLLSALFWFSVGAVTAASIRRNGLVVAIWIGLVIVAIAAGFVLALIALSQSGP